MRDFLSDIAKIVEGALAPNPDRVRSYAEHLAGRLTEAGEVVAARRLERALGRNSARPVSLSQGGGGALPVDSESRMPLADEEYVVELETTPVLPQYVKEGLDKFVSYISAADCFIANGVGISASLLLYGPPGCGKTMAARQIAQQLELPLVTARADSLISSYLGSTAKNLRLLFEHAIARPCVLFLDEFDALGKMRDDDRELGELKRVVISLLQNIDAMGPEHVLIAATNHEHLLDPAIWRRFAHKFKLDYPGPEDREILLSQFFGNFVEKRDLPVLALLTEGISGGELLEMSREAIRGALLSSSPQIDLGGFLSSIGLSRPNGLAWHKLDSAGRLAALHEAGHGGITQAELARLVGKNQTYVSRVLKKIKHDQ